MREALVWVVGISTVVGGVDGTTRGLALYAFGLFVGALFAPALAREET